MRFYFKKYIKPILIITLSVFVGILLFVGSASLLKAISNNKDDEYEKINLKWEIGGLTSTGKYSKTKKAIYTENLFECNGLITELEFTSNIEYEVYFYDENKTFISSTGLLSANVCHDLPDTAKYARIVIKPIWDYTVKTDEQVISWFDLLFGKYSSQLTVKVKIQNNVNDDDFEDLTFNYSEGDDVKYLYFDLNQFDFTFLQNDELANGYWNVLKFEKESEFLLKFISIGNDCYNLVYEGNNGNTLISFFTYNLSYNEVTEYNHDYITFKNDSLLISYDFGTLLEICAVSQDITNK